MKSQTVTWTTSHIKTVSRTHCTGFIVMMPVFGLLFLYVFGPLYAFIALMFLAVVTKSYWLSVTYFLDSTGVEFHFLGGVKKRPWSYYRRCVHLPEGLFLSPYKVPSRWELWRGDLLRFDNRMDRETIRHMVANFMERKR